MKKSVKIILLIVGTIILIAGLLFANGIYGNPISKAMAKNTAQKYLAEYYNDTDYELNDVYYNFKDGYYHVKVISPTSIDTHFDVMVSSNKVMNDSYEYDVLSGWNTWQRVDEEYREMVNAVFEAENFPLNSDIDYGEIMIIEEYGTSDPTELEFGMELSDYELDKDYDIKQLAKTSGHIVYYAQDEEISFTKASELLLILKDELDQADIPFYAIDFVLEKPRTVEGRSQETGSSIHTMNFLYADIYEDGLAERIEKAHMRLMEYYNELDKQTELKGND